MANSAQKKPPVVWAVIVCFRAEPNSVEVLAAALKCQVQRVLVLDNDAQNHVIPPRLSTEITYIPMRKNLGTAGAMNYAWHLGIQAGVDFLVCFDQDSQVSSKLVSALLSGWHLLRRRGYSPAATGPAWTDPRTTRVLQALKPAGWRRQRIAANAFEFIEVDHLITSGCLIHRVAWQEVGGFDESLFLDYVDIEWSLRARGKGFRVFVTRDAEMSHSIGDDVISIFNRSLWIHHPMRHYYLVRNHLLLWRRPYIRLSWKFRDAFQVAMKIGLLIMLRSPRRERIAWALRGLRDGLLGKTGAIM